MIITQPPLSTDGATESDTTRPATPFSVPDMGEAEGVKDAKDAKDARDAGDLADVRVVAPQPAPVTGVVIGVLADLSAGTDAVFPQAWVTFEGNPQQCAVAARMLVSLGGGDIGKPVALQFERGDIALPVIMGLFHTTANRMEAQEPVNPAQSALPPLRIASGTDEVTLTANRRLTLQCGRASITLDVDGNIELRGQDLLSRAAGQNRIKGSSVSVN